MGLRSRFGAGNSVRPHAQPMALSPRYTRWEPGEAGTWRVRGLFESSSLGEVIVVRYRMELQRQDPQLVELAVWRRILGYPHEGPADRSYGHLPLRPGDEGSWRILMKDPPRRKFHVHVRSYGRLPLLLRGTPLPASARKLICGYVGATDLGPYIWFWDDEGPAGAGEEHAAYHGAEQPKANDPKAK